MFASSCTCHASNEIDYGKINVKTNSCIYNYTHQNNLNDIEILRNISIPQVSSLLTLKRFHTLSQYFIVEIGRVLLTAFTSRDQRIDK